MQEPGAKTLLEHADFLRALARSILHDEHAAEDVAQEALLVTRRGPRAWLGAVARNLAVSRLRADRRRARRERAAARPEATGDVPAAVARLEAQQHVVEAVLALDPPYRAVVLERFFYERSLPEVAARLGVPVATARTRLRRALAALRARLERRMGPAAMIAALALLARPAAASSFTGAILMMSTKTKVAAVLLLVVLAAWVFLSPRGPGATKRSATGGSDPSIAADRPPVVTPDGAGTRPAGPLVAGRCVDSHGGMPLEGVRVRVGASEAATDALGRFAVPWPEASSAPALLASKDGYADAIAGLPAERGEADLGDLRLRPLLVLRGLVLRPDDVPAKGAIVVLRQGAWNAPATASTTADDAGRFLLQVPETASAPGPVQDQAPVNIAAYLPGFVEGRETVDDPDAELRIRLGPARAVRGLVIDENTGKGLPGAELFIAPLLSEAWRAGVSGPDGSFEVWLHPLPESPGTIVPGMEIRAKGYAPRQLLPQDIAADGNQVALAPAATVRGRVTRADGRAAAGFEVTSIRLVGHQAPSSPEMAELERRVRQGRDAPKFSIVLPYGARTRTDDAGEFTVEVPRTPPFRICAGAWPLSAEADFESLPEEPVALALRLPGELHQLFQVGVVDPAHRPIAGASVMWWAVPGAAGDGMAWFPGQWRTDGNGLADVWTMRNWTKPVLLAAWAPGWFGVSSDPVDRLRLVGTTEIVCEPAGIVSGRVVGAPLHYGARASLWWKVAGEIPWRVQIVRLSKDGRFELPGAPAGRSLLIVADPRGRSLLREIDVTKGALLDLGGVALEPPAIVRGVVRTSRGEPEPGAWVWWEPSDPYYRQVFVDPYWDRVKADENGVFELPVWVQGPVQVLAQGGPFRVAPDGVPHAGARFPMGRGVQVEYRPGSGPLTLVAERRGG